MVTRKKRGREYVLYETWSRPVPSRDCNTSYVTDPSGFELFSALWEAHTRSTSRTERSIKTGLHLQTSLQTVFADRLVTFFFRAVGNETALTVSCPDIPLISQFKISYRTANICMERTNFPCSLRNCVFNARIFFSTSVPHQQCCVSKAWHHIYLLTP